MGGVSVWNLASARGPFTVQKRPLFDENALLYISLAVSRNTGPLRPLSEYHLRLEASRAAGSKSTVVMSLPSTISCNLRRPACPDPPILAFFVSLRLGSQKSAEKSTVQNCQNWISGGKSEPMNNKNCQFFRETLNR